MAPSSKRLAKDLRAPVGIRDGNPFPIIASLTAPVEKFVILPLDGNVDVSDEIIYILYLIVVIKKGRGIPKPRPLITTPLLPLADYSKGDSLATASLGSFSLTESE